MTKVSKPPSFLQSDHLTSRSREVFISRQETDKVTEPKNLSSKAFKTLQKLLPALLPQTSILEKITINLAIRIDEALTGPRDGWRFAELPIDHQAWEQALLTIDDFYTINYNKPASDLDLNEIDILFDHLYEGKIGLDHSDRLNNLQMQKWYSDFRAEAIECFLSDYRVQNALGISSSLTGGDKALEGFQSVGPNSKESFEPATPNLATNTERSA